MLKILFEKNTFWLTLLIVLSIPAISSLLVPGFYGASDDIHIAWLYQMDQILKIGQIPPRFIPDLSYGFGYPLFNFVFPLPFYIGELFHYLGFSFVDSIKAVFLISIPLSALTMFFLLKEFSTRFISLVGAMLYIYAPYRAVDLYIRGAIGEIVAFIFLPLIALSVIKLTSFGNLKSINLKWISIGALSIAFLVLSHNITTYMFLPFMVILGLIRLYQMKKNKNIIFLNLIIMFFIGILISLYFWLPALLDSSLMKYDTVFDIKDHFPTLRQLITPYWGYGASVPGPYDGLSFFLGYSHLLVFFLSFLSIPLIWKKLDLTLKGLFLWITLVMLGVIFIMNHRSTLIWENLPLLPYFQFPWRFLIIVSFIIPFFLIFVGRLKHGSFISLFILALTLIINIGYFRPEHFLGRLDDYYLERYIPTPVPSEEYKKLNEEYLRLPQNTQVRPDQIYPRAFVLDQSLDQSNVDLNITEINKLEAEIMVNSQDQVILNYNKYLFPGWEAKLNGNSVNLQTGDPFGQIQLKIPSGENRIHFYFRETSRNLIFDLISLVTFVTTLTSLIYNLYIRYIAASRNS